MSIRSSSQKPVGQSSNRPTYLKSFREDAHRLIALGYTRIRPEELETIEEEVITERIVNAIKDLIESPGTDAWMRRYHASDNLSVSFPEREGKRRPRVDIEIIFLRHSPRPRFHFEAKRLSRSHPVGDYLGSEGLGCLVAAEYARESDEAGMLGYVQSDSCEEWAARIQRSLMENPSGYSVVSGTAWESVRLIDELPISYCTRHERHSLGRPVWVFHTLLLFCAPTSE